MMQVTTPRLASDDLFGYISLFAEQDLSKRESIVSSHVCLFLDAPNNT